MIFLPVIATYVRVIFADELLTSTKGLVDRWQYAISRNVWETYHFVISASILLPSSVSIKTSHIYALTALRAIGCSGEDVLARGSGTKSEEERSHEGIGVDMHRRGIDSMLGWSDSDGVFV